MKGDGERESVDLDSRKMMYTKREELKEGMQNRLDGELEEHEKYD